MKTEVAVLNNSSLIAATIAWLLAQSIKLFNNLILTKRIDFRYLVSTGGMPSAHSAMASALATSIGMVAGVGTPIFAVTLVFAAVVMFDAQSVRRAAGAQARLLNQIIEELFRDHHFSQNKLVELLGHTRIEVFFGMLVGVLVGLLTELYLGGA